MKKYEYHLLLHRVKGFIFVKIDSMMKKLSMDELDRISTEEYEKAEKMPVTVVLDNIRSQHNIGSVFRTSDAFRVECIHLCGITATPPHREIHKTALGATDSVKWEYFNQTEVSINKLKEQGYSIIAVEQTDKSISLEDFIYEKKEKVALIFGNEVHGIQQNLVDIAEMSLEIPQMGTKHSLNVSVSVGIVLWSIFKQFNW